MAKRKKSSSSVSVKTKKKKGKKRRGLRENGLSQAFRPQNVQDSGKAILSGIVGGAIAGLLADRVLADQKPMTKIVGTGVTAFGFAILGMKNVGAGIASQIGRDLMKPKTKTMAELSEEVNYIDKFPKYLQEGNEQAQLSQASYLSQQGLTPEERDYLINSGIGFQGM